MKEFQNYTVKLLKSLKINSQVKNLITQYHYSQSYRSLQQRYIFGLYDKSKLIGCAIYGNPISKTYNFKGILELRRVAIIDNTPKNTESWFISRTLKILKKLGENKVISYSDPNQGHFGTIYKASNFKFEGYTNELNPRVYLIGNKSVHQRQIYQKKNGQYTPDALKYQEALKTGEMEKFEVSQKEIYTYTLKPEV